MRKQIKCLLAAAAAGLLMMSTACQTAPLPGSAATVGEISSELVSVETLSPELTEPSKTADKQTEDSLQTLATNLQESQTPSPMTNESSKPGGSSATTTTIAETAAPGEHVSPDGRFGAQLDTPFTVNGIILVNKKHHVSENYQPLVTDDSRPLDPTAQTALEEMLTAAETAGYYFTKNSGYRSYGLQSDMFWAEANNIGEEAANQLTAKPGESEHQTGLAVDLTDDNNTWASFTDAFGDLDSGQWLAENAYRYGFILRYPKGKEAITGYLYEPWHFRYVGKEIASDFGPNPSLTLEEYLGVD